MGLTAYFEVVGTTLFVTVFVLLLLGKFPDFVPIFPVDFWVGNFFFFVVTFFFFISGPLIVYLSIPKSMLWRFLLLYLSYKFVEGAFGRVLDFDCEPFTVLKDFILLKLFLLDFKFVFLGFSVFTLFLFVSKLLFDFLQVRGLETDRYVL